jgi:hypothetical protein
MSTLDYSNRGSLNNNSEILTEGLVVDVNDFYKDGSIIVNNGGEIKAKPFLPIHLMVIPQKGENVNLLLKKYNKSEEYLWVGPINYDYNRLESGNSLVDKIHSNTKPITEIPEAKGIYPKLDDVVINGRYNSDIILGKNKLRIRNGFRDINNSNVYNNSTQNYHLLCNYTYNGVNRGVNVSVGEYILFNSQKGLNKFDINDVDEGITNETLNNMIDKMQSAVYGNVLIEFLKLLVEFVTNHTHNFHKMKPDDTENVKKIKRFDLSNILAKYIKLN